MTIHIDPFARQQLEVGARHLQRLEARAVAEFLMEVSSKIGGLPVMLETLAEYRRLRPEVLRAAGGDKFPRHLHVVPAP